MNILWLGAVLTDEGLANVKGETPAATIWTRGFLRGLSANDCDIRILAPVWNSYFPKGRLIPRFDEYLDQTVPSKAVPYINLPTVRQGSVARSLTRSILKAQKEHPIDVVMNYNPYPHYCTAIKNAQQKLPNLRWLNICLDFDDPVADSWARFQNMTQGAAGSVFLSWWGYQNCPIQRKLHLDGGVDLPEFQASSEGGSSKPVFLYAGKLASYGGVDQLIQAIVESKVDAEFHFYGKGEYEALQQAQASDSRIRIFGFVDQATLDQAHCNATAILAPRTLGFQGTRMIFPSKVLNAIPFGKPIISPWLPGYSEDYRDVLEIIPDDSADSWNSAFERILGHSKDHFLQVKNRMRKLAETRLWSNQGKRIIEFIRDIENES